MNKFLERMSKNNPNISKWEFLEEIVKKQPKTKEEETSQDYIYFIQKTVARHSGEDIQEKLLFLWTLIARRILKYKPEDQEVRLPDSYFEELKKM